MCPLLNTGQTHIFYEKKINFSRYNIIIFKFNFFPLILSKTVLTLCGNYSGETFTY